MLSRISLLFLLLSYGFRTKACREIPEDEHVLDVSHDLEDYKIIKANDTVDGFNISGCILLGDYAMRVVEDDWSIRLYLTSEKDKFAPEELVKAWEKIIAAHWDSLAYGTRYFDAVPRLGGVIALLREGSPSENCYFSLFLNMQCYLDIKKELFQYKRIAVRLNTNTTIDVIRMTPDFLLMACYGSTRNVCMTVKDTDVNGKYLCLDVEYKSPRGQREMEFKNIKQFSFADMCVDIYDDKFEKIVKTGVPIHELNQYIVKSYQGSTNAEKTFDSIFDPDEFIGTMDFSLYINNSFTFSCSAKGQMLKPLNVRFCTGHFCNWLDEKMRPPENRCPTLLALSNEKCFWVVDNGRFLTLNNFHTLHKRFYTLTPKKVPYIELEGYRTEFCLNYTSWDEYVFKQVYLTFEAKLPSVNTTEVEDGIAHYCQTSTGIIEQGVPVNLTERFTVISSPYHGKFTCTIRLNKAKRGGTKVLMDVSFNDDSCKPITKIPTDKYTSPICHEPQVVRLLSDGSYNESDFKPFFTYTDIYALSQLANEVALYNDSGNSYQINRCLNRINEPISCRGQCYMYRHEYNKISQGCTDDLDHEAFNEATACRLKKNGDFMYKNQCFFISGPLENRLDYFSSNGVLCCISSKSHLSHRDVIEKYKQGLPQPEELNITRVGSLNYNYHEDDVQIQHLFPREVERFHIDL
ncbi:unnamed protein product [Bursaphelenchus okinawaensis]|uniref:Uncharacterized protein n=1 Tax=Bursaphelenchus okinawaensis TaxID=465554 RepID=A0A811LE99_9BILA|nr:unnamed protein product [Bursaphelenchus okinawaensis]CAG9120968.1 unnamed protein product [Bursaphelenchus okinawaensis]